MTTLGIGPVTLEKAKTAISNDLENWWEQIKEAFIKNDYTLAVGLSLKFQSNGGGKIEVEHGITFIESRVKDKDVIIVDEKQQKLPGMP